MNDQNAPFDTNARDAGGAFTIPTLYQDWVKAFGGSVREAQTRADAARTRVAALRDPFMPLARGDQKARAKEKVLFEDEQIMVLSDLFARSAKLLVVPKSETLFLCDMNDKARAHLEKISGAAQHAFKILHNANARAWVNPPSALSVRQLHVHIQPNLSGDKNDIEASVAAWLRDYFAPEKAGGAREIEFKFGVKDADALARFEHFLLEKKAGDKKESVLQSNTFFDAEGRLNDAFCTLRLRHEHDAEKHVYELTLKGKETSEGKLTKKAESEWRLSKGEHDALLSGEKDAWVLAREKAGEPDRGLMKTFANLIGERAVSVIGSFSNVRTRVLAAGFVFEIDHSRFPDESSGCEVEIEVPASKSDAEEILSAFFDEAGVKTQKASSKAKRFFDAIKGRA